MMKNAIHFKSMRSVSKKNYYNAKELFSHFISVNIVSFSKKYIGTLYIRI